MIAVGMSWLCHAVCSMARAHGARGGREERDRPLESCRYAVELYVPYSVLTLRYYIQSKTVQCQTLHFPQKKPVRKDAPALLIVVVRSHLTFRAREHWGGRPTHQWFGKDRSACVRTFAPEHSPNAPRRAMFSRAKDTENHHSRKERARAKNAEPPCTALLRASCGLGAVVLRACVCCIVCRASRVGDSERCAPLSARGSGDDRAGARCTACGLGDGREF